MKSLIRLIQCFKAKSRAFVMTVSFDYFCQSTAHSWHSWCHSKRTKRYEKPLTLLTKLSRPWVAIWGLEAAEWDNKADKSGNLLAVERIITCSISLPISKQGFEASVLILETVFNKFSGCDHERTTNCSHLRSPLAEPAATFFVWPDWPDKRIRHSNTFDKTLAGSTDLRSHYGNASSASNIAIHCLWSTHALFGLGKSEIKMGPMRLLFALNLDHFPLRKN